MNFTVTNFILSWKTNVHVFLHLTQIVISWCVGRAFFLMSVAPWPTWITMITLSVITLRVVWSTLHVLKKKRSTIIKSGDSRNGAKRVIEACTGELDATFPIMPEVPFSSGAFNWKVWFYSCPFPASKAWCINSSESYLIPLVCVCVSLNYVVTKSC